MVVKFVKDASSNKKNLSTKIENKKAGRFITEKQKTKKLAASKAPNMSGQTSAERKIEGENQKVLPQTNENRRSFAMLIGLLLLPFIFIMSLKVKKFIK